MKEIEKKFLLLGSTIKQGYLPIEKGKELIKLLGIKFNFDSDVIRLRKENKTYYLTIKSRGLVSRDELELEVSKGIFEKYWEYTKGRRVEKRRIRIPYADKVLEVDIFTDRDLVLAEIEVDSLDELEHIPNIGIDVTKNKYYANSYLAK